MPILCDKPNRPVARVVLAAFAAASCYDTHVYGMGYEATSNSGGLVKGEEQSLRVEALCIGGQISAHVDEDMLRMRSGRLQPQVNLSDWDCILPTFESTEH